MKRVICAILAMLMLLALAACGEKETDLSGAVLDAANSAGGTDGGNTESAAQPSAEVTQDGSAYETSLFSVAYRPEDGWLVDTENTSDNADYQNAQLTLYIPGTEEDEHLVTAEISASVEDHHEFRSSLLSYGFDLHGYAVENAYPLTNVGGVDCVTSDMSYWGNDAIRYLGRDPACQTTVSFVAYGDVSDTAVIQALVDGISFVLTPADGAQEAPWPWDGTPYAPEAYGPQTLGTVTLTPTFVKAGEPIITNETFDHSVAVIGNQVYLLSDGVLSQYTLSGDTLTYVGDIALPGDEYTRIEADANGVLHVSGFMETYIGLKDGQQVFSYADVDDRIAIAPSGTWGVAYFTSGECQKVDCASGTPVITDLVFGEVKSVSWVQVTDTHILLSGYSNADDDQYVFVYDLNGALLSQLKAGEENWIGSITFMAETANGILAMDGNMRTVHVWDAQGNYLGAADDAALFGTDYPWFAGSCKCADGSILTVMVDERADQSADEVIFYRLTGI